MMVSTAALSLYFQLHYLLADTVSTPHVLVSG